MFVASGSRRTGSRSWRPASAAVLPRSLGRRHLLSPWASPALQCRVSRCSPGFGRVTALGRGRLSWADPGRPGAGCFLSASSGPGTRTRRSPRPGSGMSHLSGEGPPSGELRSLVRWLLRMLRTGGCRNWSARGWVCADAVFTPAPKLI